jgi:hypothetical protein
MSKSITVEIPEAEAANLESALDELWIKSGPN